MPAGSLPTPFCNDNDSNDNVDNAHIYDNDDNDHINDNDENSEVNPE